MHENCNQSWQFAGVDKVFSPISSALTVTISGVGSVHGTSTLGQSYACLSGVCGAIPFAYGETVTLTATDSADYHFKEWGVDCAATSGNCILTMTADRNVTATFVYVKPFRLFYQLTATDHDSLADAYDAVSDNSSATIYGRVFTCAINGGLNMMRPVTLLFKGGYDSTFNSNASGFTTLQGRLIVGRGELTVERLIVE